MRKADSEQKGTGGFKKIDSETVDFKKNASERNSSPLDGRADIDHMRLPRAGPNQDHTQDHHHGHGGGLLLGQILEIANCLLDHHEVKLCSLLLDELAESHHGSHATSVTSDYLTNCVAGINKRSADSVHFVMQVARSPHQQIRQKRISALGDRADVLGGRASSLEESDVDGRIPRSNDIDEYDTIRSPAMNHTTVESDGEQLIESILECVDGADYDDPDEPIFAAPKKLEPKAPAGCPPFENSFRNLRLNDAHESSAAEDRPAVTTQVSSNKKVGFSREESEKAKTSIPLSTSSRQNSPNADKKPRNGFASESNDLPDHAGATGSNKFAERAKTIDRFAWDDDEEEIEALNVLEEEDGVDSIKSHKWIIHPNSIVKHYWDFITLLWILVDSLVVPLNVGFDFMISDGWFWFTTVWFCIDIISTSITGYYREGHLVMRQRKILGKYLLSGASIDIISTIPWGFLATRDSENDGGVTQWFAEYGKLLRILRLMRLVRLNGLLNRLEDVLPHHSVIVTITITKMVSTFTLICHWTACLWGFIGNPEKVGYATPTSEPYNIDDCEPGGACEGGVMGSPWIRRYGLDDPRYGDIGTQYLASLGYAVGLITGGELGMSPSWWAERLFTLVMMVVSFLLCSAILSQIVVWMDKFSMHQTEFRETMASVKQYMARRKVPLTLRAKVKRYLEFQFHSRRVQGEGIDFISQLSPWLRLELKEHLNRDIILRHPVFQNMHNLAFKRICGMAEMVLYAPGDIVAQRGNQASCMFFIVQGRLKIIGTSTVLESPSWIGDQCLFKDMTRTRTVICLSHVELLTLPNDLFEIVLKEFPNLESWYKEWCRKVLNGELIDCGMQCSVCLGFGHTLENCPKAMEQLKAHVEMTAIQSNRKARQTTRNKSLFVTLTHGLTTKTRSAAAKLKTIAHLPGFTGVPRHSKESRTSVVSVVSDSETKAQHEVSLGNS